MDERTSSSLVCARHPDGRAPGCNPSTRPMPKSRLLVVASAVLTLLVAAGPAAADTLQPGIGFVDVIGSTQGTEYVLDNASHTEVTRGNADQFGSLIFRDLTQGA